MTELKPFNDEALATIKMMNEMKRSLELIEVTKTHKHRVEYNDDHGVLWCTCIIEKQVVNAGFKVVGLTEDRWKDNEGFLLAQTVPLMYRMRRKGESFSTFDLSL